MTNVVPLFAFEGQRLRTTFIDNQPWFVAADACRILNFDLRAGTANHLFKLDQDEKQLVRRLDIPELFEGKRGAPSATLISRPGLFKLIARSSKPEAKRFDRWVRHEVLPQIMDTGGYLMRDADVDTVVANTSSKSRANIGLLNQLMSAVQAAQVCGEDAGIRWQTAAGNRPIASHGNRGRGWHVISAS